MLSKVVHDDFVWTAIAGMLTGTKRGSNGAQMINCPMCVLRGETPDRRFRCGVTRRPDGVIIHCYNCAFATTFKMGEALSMNMRKFLERIGVPSRDVQRMCHKALQYRRMISSSPEAQAIIPTTHKVSFPHVALPDGAFKLTEWAENGIDDPDFFAVAEYLFSRGNSISQSDNFYWTPSKDRELNRRLIIPFTYDGQNVGWTGRLVDSSTPEKPKYWSSVPPNYLFNNEFLELDRKFVIVVEGPMDALAIDGVATLGAKVSDEQSRWLNTCGKQVIVLADRDRSGQRLIDHALVNNWMVSFPKLKDGHGFNNWWDSDVKDAADAAKKYGKLYAVRSILESATASKMEINIKQKLLY